jgi:cyanophycinase
MKRDSTLAVVMLSAALALGSLSAFSCKAGGPAGSAASPPAAGYILAVGGGDRPEGVMRKFVELAVRGGKSRVVVFTMASGVPEETGPELVAELEAAGAKDVVRYHLTREEALRPETASILDNAGGVFFSGGDQSRLTAVLLDTPVHKRLSELYRDGAVIGGTSAGAAAMSEVMITGDEKRKVEPGDEWTVIEADNIVTARGLGFVRNAIIDQHFLKRRRFNRLLSLVLENPQLVGLGIDEPAAVLVRPDGKVEVLGDRQVLALDARHAAVSKTASGKLGASGVTMHVLLGGDVYDPASGRVERGSR